MLVVDRAQPATLTADPETWRCSKCERVIGVVQARWFYVKENGREFQIEFLRVRQRCRCGQWNFWPVVPAA